MSEQSGFRNNGTKTARLRKANDGDDHMKKKSEDVAHGGMVSNLKNPAIQGNWGIRHIHAIIVKIKGRSYRARKAKTGKPSSEDQSAS